MNAHIQNSHLPKEREYWQRKLAGLSRATGFPTESLKEQDPESMVLPLEFTLESDTVEFMQKVAHTNETMVFGILLSALAVCLKKYTGFEDIVIGSAIHERYKSPAFSNGLLLLRNRVGDHVTVRELLEAVRQTLTEAYENQRCSVDALLNPQSDPCWQPFRVAIVLKTIHNPENILGRGQDATLIFSGADKHYAAAITYNPARLDPRTFHEFWRIFRHVLREMLQHPDQTIVALRLLSIEQRQQLSPPQSAGAECATNRTHRKCYVDAQLYVLDANCDPVPTRVPGELFAATRDFSSDGVTLRGETSTCAREPSFEERSSEPLFRTGELARRLWDGQIEVLGKLAEQSNLQGFAIRPFEVEDMLNEHPGIYASAMVLHGLDITAYIVVRHDLNRKDVANYLARRLPSGFPAVRLVEVSQLPLQADGVVDRAGLARLPASSGDDGDAPFVAPRSNAEELMAQIWREVLCADRVGVFDNFFELGGHSLLAMKICGKIAHTLMCEAKVVDLFNNPTIASLARCLAERRSSA